MHEMPYYGILIIMWVNGRKIADQMLQDLEGKNTKKVCFIVFNQNQAGESYVSLKARVAKRLNVEVEIIKEDIDSTEEAVGLIQKISKGKYDGVVVQLPLPEAIKVREVLNSIPPELDIDVLSDAAKENFVKGNSERVPPVAGAIQKIFDEHNVTTRDKKIVVLGKGRLVGEPAGMLFDRLGHEYTSLDRLTPKEDLFARIREADILVSGTGDPHFLKSKMIKEGVVLIDAGTSGESGELQGDADPECESKAALMTPVPGGIGPITVSVLFSNLFKER